MLISGKIFDINFDINLKKDFQLSIGSKIKNLREQKGWSQRDLAKKINCHQPHLNRWETGKIIPSIDTLKQISKAFDVSIDALVFDEKDIKDLGIKDRSLISKLKEFSQLSEQDKSAVITIIDSFISKQSS